MEPHTRADLDLILQRVTGAATTLDELGLLRMALRRYMEGHPADEAVAWAANEISKSLTSHP